MTINGYLGKRESPGKITRSELRELFVEMVLKHRKQTAKKKK